MRFWLILILVLIFPGIFQAQVPVGSQAQLPALRPTQIDVLVTGKDFPNICFDEIFIGPRGRLFLRSCALTSQRQEIYLLQYDGYDFQPIEISLPENLAWPKQRPRFTHLDNKNRLIGHYVNALLIFDLNSRQTQLIPLDSLQGLGKMILHTAAGENGETWILAKDSTRAFVLRYAGGTFQQVGDLPTKSTGFSAGTLFSPSTILYHKGELWFIDSHRLIFQLDPKTGTYKQHELPLPSTNGYEDDIPFIWNLTTAQNTIFCSVLHGDTNLLMKWSPDAKKFVQIPITKKSGQPCKIFKDEVGNVVMLTQPLSGKLEALLIDSSGKKFDYSPVLQGIEKTITKLVGQDFKNRVMVLTKGGLFHVSLQQPGSIKTYLPDRPIRGLIELPSGDVLVAEDKQQYFFLLSRPESPIREPYHNDKTIWKGQRFLPDGKYIWYQSKGKFQALFRFDLQDYSIDTFHFDFQINRIAVLAPEILVLAEIPYLHVFNAQNGRLERYTENGTPKIFDFGKQVHDIKVGKDKTVWIGSNGGLWQVDLSRHKSKHLGLKAGFRDTRVQVICESRTGQIWFGTILGGLHIYDPKTGSIRVINRARGLANNTVVSILEDDEGMIWVGTYDGLSLVNPAGQVCLNLGKSDGLSHPEFNRFSYLKTKSGDLLFGTLRGLNRITPGKVKASLTQILPVQVYLTQLSSSDPKTGKTRVRLTALDSLAPIPLTADKCFLEISFALSEYNQSKNHVFAYKLDRPNQQWIHIGTRHKLSLSDLPAGEYDLLIKGMAHSGNWSEPLRIPLRVSAFFYQQNWFYGLCLLLCLAIVFAWTYRLRSHKQILPTKVVIEHTGDLQQNWLEQLEIHAKNALAGKGPLTTKYLAEQMSISERQLLRRLKAETGMTIKAFMQEIKLQKAQQLLEAKTFGTIAEVAYACGFNTPAYFSTVFEKRFGKRPRTYFD